jgi:hypothetical protein
MFHCASYHSFYLKIDETVIVKSSKYVASQKVVRYLLS